MSAHRRPEIRFSDAPRGTCRWCGEPILHTSGPRKGERNARRRWHPRCVDVYNQSDPREARRAMRKRDRGRCAECGLDTLALRRRLRGRGSHRKLRELGFQPRRSLWELDHIVPLIDGGGHDVSNLQTLCTPCHRRKTAREAEERVRRRQDERAAAILSQADAALARSEEILASLEPAPSAGGRARSGETPRARSVTQDSPAGTQAAAKRPRAALPRPAAESRRSAPPRHGRR